jgi:hypothetical protein
MISFYFDKQTQLIKTVSRGFSPIGSATFADMFMTWFRSSSDCSGLP